ncbi:hypothetical protein [Ramlibacter sp. WS9]|uniref:hypothetical protein n=1 Tax=Ramlibacter sp. WS9 TaxID=1882741 RepID=UPI0011420BF6|nr:hypothetical protein [Ramlibacter sp. WS9]ROZ64429.1 hypothetical protein EEB15_28515 [Ramlibacter sp. WS9]
MYPEEAYKRKEGGTVNIEMEFATQDLAPKIKVHSGEASVELVSAVHEYALRLRLPCAKSHEPAVRLEQEFVFVPNDGRKVAWTIARSPSGTPKIAHCVQHLEPGSKPIYPSKAGREGRQGSVLANVLFTAVNEKPQVTFPDPSPYPELAEAVRRFAEDYRLTCWDGKPLLAFQQFNFRMDDGEKKLLKDISLLTFVRAARNATAMPVFFSLDGMGCPFDVRLRYWQPIYRNEVGEVGSEVPARRAFLDWLSTLVLDLPAKSQNAILGDTMTVSVPCGKIDL